MVEGNPISFTDQGFDDAELNTGVAGGEQIDPQWALATMTDVEFRRSRTKQTPGLHMRVVLDASYALTPKRSCFHDLYLSEKMQSQIDGFTVACGLGRSNERIGAATSARDTRTQVADVEAAGKAMAAALEGKQAIVAIGIEVSEGYDDRNRITGFHRVTEENLAAIKAAGYAPKGVVVKKRQDGGRTRNYLAAKVGGAAAKAGAKPTTAVID